MTLTFRARLGPESKFESEDPLGDAIRSFEEEIGLHGGSTAEAIALAMHKEFMRQQGKEWDDTPVSVGDSDRWWDQDVEYTSMRDLNKKLTRKVVLWRSSCSTCTTP
jgi:hypothetical protein